MVAEAAQWPEETVAEFVDRVMLAKHGGMEPKAEASWRSEIRRRLEDLESGRVKGVPLEETLAKARAILGQ